MLLYAQLASTSLSARDFLLLAGKATCKTHGGTEYHQHTCRVRSLMCPTTLVSRPAGIFSVLLYCALKELLLILLLCSIPGTERPNWPWQCPHYFRTCGQIYCQHAEKMPDRGHQSRSAKGRCCSRLHRAHPSLHATDFLVRQLSVVVQEWHSRWAHHCAASWEPHSLVPHA